MKYNKLVRDKIPEHIRSKGGDPRWHTADRNEYWEKLKAKLIEEALEFQSAESIEELAGVFEVLQAILDHRGITNEQILRARLDKCTDKGAFLRRIILDEA